MLTIQQILAAKMVGLALLETIDEAAQEGPVPEGVLYAGLQAQGASFNQYQSFMQNMASAKFIEREGDCVTITEAGRKAKERFKGEVAELKTRLQMH